MTKAELAATLDRMDPGTVLDLSPDVLGEAFPDLADPAAGAPEMERFAEAHRCTFCPALGGASPPHFIKSDVY